MTDRPGQMSPDDQRKQEEFISSLPDLFFDYCETDEDFLFPVDKRFAPT